MKKYLLMISVLLIAADPFVPPDEPTLPRYPPPEVVVADASEKDGSVRVRLWIPVPHVVTVERTIERDGKNINMDLATYRYSKWFRVDLKADGEQVQAFDVEGKKIAPKELLKRLAKETHVVLFKDDPPDPYYLGVLRPDTVVLKAPGYEVTPPQPNSGRVPVRE